MNGEQKQAVAEKIAALRQAIDELQHGVQNDEVTTGIESHRQAIDMLEDDTFMEGMYDSLAAVQRGERGVRLSEIERERTRARRVSS